MQTNIELVDKLRMTTLSWVHEPKFIQKLHRSGPFTLRSSVSTTSRIYIMLNDGTKVRYSVMTRDFVSKTVPQWVGSRLGRGGFSHFDLKNPRPGIQARRWTEAIKRQYRPLEKISIITRDELRDADIFV